MAIAVVGAGRVGTVLATALQQSGRDVIGIVARSASSQQRASQAVPTVPVIHLDGPELHSADILLLAVADDDLPDVVRTLAAEATSDQFVAHTSGRHGLAVLQPLPGPKAAIHPAMTFAGGPGDIARLPGIVYGLTAGEEALPTALTLVEDLHGRPAIIAEAARPLYHAAMSHAANHLVTLIADATDLLRKAGIDDPHALAPITQAALANALRDGDSALTGPVVRGDVETVRAHLQALIGEPAKDAYAAMATRTAERARDSGRLSAEQAARIIAELGAHRPSR